MINSEQRNEANSISLALDLPTDAHYLLFSLYVNSEVNSVSHDKFTFEVGCLLA